MPQSRSYDRDYYAPRRAYSPSSSTASIASEPHDRHGRTVQPYQHSSRFSRDPRAVQRYHDYPPSSHGNSSRPLARRRSDSYLGAQSQQPRGSRKDQSVGWVKGHGGELIGAAVGGYAGHRAGDDHLKTASGAAVGAIGGKVLERYYSKWSDKREDKKVGREVRNGRDPYGDRGSPYSSDEDSRYPVAPSRSRRDSRSLNREPARGRARSQSQGWRDMGRQLKRSLSRKKSRERADVWEGARERQENPRSWKDLGREIKRNVSRRREEKQGAYDDGYGSEY